MDLSDPRARRSRAAILDAAQQLLVEHGPAAVTHARTAEQAGVGRATVYRHWPRAEDLLAEAMAGSPMPFFAAPGPVTRAWMRAEIEALGHQLGLDEVRAVTATLAAGAQWDPAMDSRRQGFAQVLTERVEAAVASARDSGALSPTVPPGRAAALLIGPLYYRGTIERAPLDDALVDAVLDSIGSWSA